MTTLKSLSWGLIALALAAGSFPEPRPARPNLIIGGYRVLTVDFHVHTQPLSWATLAPWDTVIEARRRGLDAFALAGQNNVWTAKTGRWFSSMIAGPTVLVSEEVHAPQHHIIAVGIHSSIDWRLTAAGTIDEIHRQGGVAIAAHPVAAYWPGWDAAAMKNLDAAEVLHPLAYSDPEAGRQMREFFDRKPLAAIGSSDFHGLQYIGICRTYVFARDNSESSILEALRKRRTAVFDRNGNAYGDPQLIRLAVNAGALPLAENQPQGTWWTGLSGIVGVLGLVGIIFSAEPLAGMRTGVRC